MKITFKKVLVLIAFISFTMGAKAQYSAVPDTSRLSIGIDGASTSGAFGDQYKFGIGASLQYDIPLNDKFYITANVGYTMFSANSSTSNPNYILNVKPSNMNVAPLKLGLKYFLIRTFYIQGEAGETLLLNKSAVYAQNSAAFTWAPQMGLLFRLKQKSYLDVGLRYQKTENFYGDGSRNNIWALRIAYALNLK